MRKCNQLSSANDSQPFLKVDSQIVINLHRGLSPNTPPPLQKNPTAERKPSPGRSPQDQKITRTLKEIAQVCLATTKWLTETKRRIKSIS